MDYLAVGAAGFIGAICRGFLGNISIVPNTVFPINTLLINLTGSFVLCFFLTITIERLELNPRLRLAFSTGFLGAYTTFSTFTLEVVKLINSNNLWLSIIYVILSIFGGLFCAWLGITLAKYIINYNIKSKEIKEAE